MGDVCAVSSLKPTKTIALLKNRQNILQRTIFWSACLSASDTSPLRCLKANWGQIRYKWPKPHLFTYTSHWHPFQLWSLFKNIYVVKIQLRLVMQYGLISNIWFVYQSCEFSNYTKNNQPLRFSCQSVFINSVRIPFKHKIH